MPDILAAGLCVQGTVRLTRLADECTGLVWQISLFCVTFVRTNFSNNHYEHIRTDQATDSSRFT